MSIKIYIILDFISIQLESSLCIPCKFMRFSKLIIIMFSICSFLLSSIMNYGKYYLNYFSKFRPKLIEQNLIQKQLGKFLAKYFSTIRASVSMTRLKWEIQCLWNFWVSIISKWWITTLLYCLFFIQLSEITLNSKDLDGSRFPINIPSINLHSIWSEYLTCMVRLKML